MTEKYIPKTEEEVMCNKLFDRALDTGSSSFSLIDIPTTIENSEELKKKVERIIEEAIQTRKSIGNHLEEDESNFKKLYEAISNDLKSGRFSKGMMNVITDLEIKETGGSEITGKEAAYMVLKKIMLNQDVFDKKNTPRINKIINKIHGREDSPLTKVERRNYKESKRLNKM